MGTSHPWYDTVLRIEVALLIGIMCGVKWNILNPVSFFVCVLLIIGFYFTKKPWFAEVSLLLLAFIGGSFVMDQSLEIFQEHQITFPREVQSHQVKIISYPRPQTFATQYFVEDDQNRQFFVSLDTQNLQYGTILNISGEFSIPDSQGVRRYLIGKNSLGYVSVDSFTILQDTCSDVLCHLIRGIYSIKTWFLQRLDIFYPGSSGEFLKGILLGYTAELPDTLKKSFQTTGVSHILAVSGYNVAIILTLLYQNMLSLHMRRKLAFGITLISILIFATITGAEASILRASIFAIITLWNEQQQKYTSGIRIILFTAVIMVLYNPKYLIFDIGFQLSFLAVLGLVIYGRHMKSITQGIPQLFGVGMIGETVVAQLVVLPLLIYYFGTISVISLLANILMIPFIPFLMAIGFISVIIPPVPIILGIIQFCIELLLNINLLLSTIPLATIQVPDMPDILLIGIYAVLGICMSYFWRRKI